MAADDGWFRLRMNDTSLPDLYTATENALLHWKFGVAEPWHWFHDSANVLALVHCHHSERLFCAHANGTITVRSLQKPDEVVQFGKHGQQAVRSLALSADGGRLFSGSWDCSCVLWDAATAQVIQRLEHHSDRVNVVVCNAAADTCYSAGQDGCILQYRITTQMNSLKVLRHHERAVRALALTDDGETLFSAGWEGAVCVWQAGALREVLQPHTSAVNSLSWSSMYPERIFSCGNDGTVQVWNWQSATRLRTLDIGGGAIKCVICRAELLFWGDHEGTLHQVTVEEDGIEQPMLYKANRFVGGITALCFAGAVHFEPVVLRGLPGTGNS